MAVNFSGILQALSSRIIYACLFVLLLIAIALRLSFPPARLHSADQAFTVIEQLESGSRMPALVGLEYGPGTQAENDPQAKAVIEHLFRKNIPVVIFTTYALAEKFAVNAPQVVADEINRQRLALNPSETNLIEYGKHWITLGYRPGAALFFQALSQSKDLASYLGKDIRGVRVKEYPSFQGLRTLSDVSVVAYFSGLAGLLNTYIQFLQHNGMPPKMVHGCTSISIPEAFIFLESGQLKGVLEGVAGAAWYSKRLREQFAVSEVSIAERANSILGVGQLFVLFLIIAGNIIGVLNFMCQRQKKVLHG